MVGIAAPRHPRPEREDCVRRSESPTSASHPSTDHYVGPLLVRVVGGVLNLCAGRAASGQRVHRGGSRRRLTVVGPLAPRPVALMVLTRGVGHPPGRDAGVAGIACSSAGPTVPACPRTPPGPPASPATCGCHPEIPDAGVSRSFRIPNATANDHDEDQGTSRARRCHKRTRLHGRTSLIIRIIGALGPRITSHAVANVECQREGVHMGFSNGHTTSSRPRPTRRSTPREARRDAGPLLREDARTDHPRCVGPGRHRGSRKQIELQETQLQHTVEPPPGSGEKRQSPRIVRTWRKRRWQRKGDRPGPARCHGATARAAYRGGGQAHPDALGPQARVNAFRTQKETLKAQYNTAPRRSPPSMRASRGSPSP